jgi:ring-1,2-phenylacetyl-CoA epoxidase subunit PaaC
MSAPVDYLLHLADNAVVLGQRNAEWCGHGPILEKTSPGQRQPRLIGQARLLSAGRHPHGRRRHRGQAGLLPRRTQFRNYTLLELPHNGPLVGYAVSDRDYATTIVRNFLYGADGAGVGRAGEVADADLAAIAAKSSRSRYHLHHAATGWCASVTAPTNPISAPRRRWITSSLHRGVLDPSPAEAAVAAGAGVDVRSLRAAWDAIVNETLAEATLVRPQVRGYVPEGKHGRHSEHLGFLLGEMQSLARAHPGATW